MWCLMIFTTVYLVEREGEPPPHWKDLSSEKTEYMPINTPPPLSPEWLAESDTQSTSRIETRTNQVQHDLQT